MVRHKPSHRIKPCKEICDSDLGKLSCWSSFPLMGRIFLVWLAVSWLSLILPFILFFKFFICDIYSSLSLVIICKWIQWCFYLCSPLNPCVQRKLNAYWIIADRLSFRLQASCTGNDRWLEKRCILDEIIDIRNFIALVFLHCIGCLCSIKHFIEVEVYGDFIVT